MADKKANKKNSKKPTSQEYVNNIMIPQIKELISTYQPDIIWGDGHWEQSSLYWKSAEIFEYLYNESPVAEKIVSNDRWGKDAKYKFSI